MYTGRSSWFFIWVPGERCYLVDLLKPHTKNFKSISIFYINHSVLRILSFVFLSSFSARNDEQKS